jgi:hypothetical protein
MEQREEAIKQLRPGVPEVALVANSPSVASASSSPPPTTPIAQVAAAAGTRINHKSPGAVGTSSNQK